MRVEIKRLVGEKLNANLVTSDQAELTVAREVWKERMKERYCESEKEREGKRII